MLESPKPEKEKKPRRLLSLQYNISDSEDEETREERKARIVSACVALLRLKGGVLWGGGGHRGLRIKCRERMMYSETTKWDFIPILDRALFCLMVRLV